MKTFIEKISNADGSSVIVNYTSAVEDATLERTWRCKVHPGENAPPKSRTLPWDTAAATTLGQLRKAVWEAYGSYKKLAGGHLLSAAEKAVYAS
jgi:hypothetical protein